MFVAIRITTMRTRLRHGGLFRRAQAVINLGEFVVAFDLNAKMVNAGRIALH